ncbi:DUF1501 domain-containing protein, partial [bacterium AH-315-P07]|nr:DUF1501 domain-containing protein [bacterium AH-315-P07]
RHFFEECGVGVGKIALASLLAGNSAFAANTLNPLAVKAPHFAAKAKRVIYLFMAGAPSQLDLFDFKPTLKKYDGVKIPESVLKDQRYAFITQNSSMMATPFTFAKHGQSGTELSEMLPHLSEVVDDIALIKSVHTDQFNHAPAQILFSTGEARPGNPSMGSWVTYGLGSEAEDLPGFVVMNSGGGTSGGPANWGCGFMPTIYQGVPFRGKGDPILNLANPKGVSDETQRKSLDMLNTLNKHRLDIVNDPEIASRINSYELAYRMQTSAPNAVDISKESKETLEMYGAKPGESSFANNCLLARRLVERGVRFVNLYHTGWDHHSNVEGGLKSQCGQTDRASAALLKDLKQRGLLEDTLVIWGGEFGRTPMVETSAALGRSRGRDHHPQAFTMWMAGGGIKPGQTIGETDELGMQIIKRPIHVHDIQATILYLLGLDHLKLTYAFKGRDFRLTNVSGEVIPELLA